MAVGLATVALLAGACSGGSSDDGGKVARAAPTGKANVQNGSGREPDPIAYSKCMRQKGVTEFPDPVNGGLSIDGDKVKMDSPTYKAAEKACQYLMPPPPPGSEDDGKNRAEALKYSKCMRENGVPNFPDPNAQGGLNIDAEKMGGMGPDNPVFQKAEKTCHQKLGIKGNSNQHNARP
ncbi:hypothetical protein [Thermomonospora umbrina]|nr:hypothetical protein [Thermomonospora umbrina]